MTLTSEKSDPTPHLAEAFAREIADDIAARQHKGLLRGYALVAAPRFLGMLRTQLGSRVSEEPYATVDKNVVGHPAVVVSRLLGG